MRAVRPVSLALLLMLVTAVGIATAVVQRGGYRLYIVHTGSMTPTLKPGDVVVDTPARHLHPGQIITFRHSASATDVVTHRVVGLHGDLIHTKGDANHTADVWEIRPDQVRGTVARDLPRLGYVLVFLKQPSGVASLMTGALAVVLLSGLFFPGTGPHPGLHSAGESANNGSSTRDRRVTDRYDEVPLQGTGITGPSVAGVVRRSDRFSPYAGGIPPHGKDHRVR